VPVTRRLKMRVSAMSRAVCVSRAVYAVSDRPT